MVWGLGPSLGDLLFGSAELVRPEPFFGNVGALIIRIGFRGFPYYNYGIINPQTLF